MSKHTYKEFEKHLELTMNVERITKQINTLKEKEKEIQKNIKIQSKMLKKYIDKLKGANNE